MLILLWVCDLDVAITDRWFQRFHLFHRQLHCRRRHRRLVLSRHFTANSQSRQSRPAFAWNQWTNNSKRVDDVARVAQTLSIAQALLHEQTDADRQQLQTLPNNKGRLELAASRAISNICLMDNLGSIHKLLQHFIFHVVAPQTDSYFTRLDWNNADKLTLKN